MSYSLHATRYKLFVGFITYGEATYKYLPYFLNSLGEQTYKDFQILAFDNSENFHGNADYLIDSHPEIKLIRSEENLGFARAYNKMIRMARESGAKYFLALNPDMILEPDAIEKMIRAIENDGELASVSPVVFSWDFENNKKTKIIDTCGIKMKPGLRFEDIAQGKEVVSESELSEILGPSGAAALYRMDSLEKIRKKDEYFDEAMFMYKEDCDLAYRLFFSGFKSKCVNESVIYHDRTAKSLGGITKIFQTRKNKSKKVREWSFLNQHIIFLKYWSLQNKKNKFYIILYALKMFFFALLFERFLLKQYFIIQRFKNSKIEGFKI